MEIDGGGDPRGWGKGGADLHLAAELKPPSARGGGGMLTTGPSPPPRDLAPTVPKLYFPTALYLPGSVHNPTAIPAYKSSGKYPLGSARISPAQELARDAKNLGGNVSCRGALGLPEGSGHRGGRRPGPGRRPRWPTSEGSAGGPLRARNGGKGSIGTKRRSGLQHIHNHGQRGGG